MLQILISSLPETQFKMITTASLNSGENNWDNTSHVASTQPGPQMVLLPLWLVAVTPPSHHQSLDYPTLNILGTQTFQCPFPPFSPGLPSSPPKVWLITCWATDLGLL